MAGSLRDRKDPADAPAAGSTLACVSIHKTGSTALTAALRTAGHADALHLHFLGPLAHATGATQPQGSPDISARVADLGHRFRVVTCVRDPIARILSEAFHNAPQGVTPKRDEVIAWIDSRRFVEGSGPWFDDTFRTPFGFDFRLHAFDAGRLSVRFSSDRLKLLVLRHEDPPERKEIELGWLVDRERAPIPRLNDSTSRFGPAYAAFVDGFVAPRHWLETLYETEIARHFYSQHEREAMRAHWSAPRERR